MNTSPWSPEEIRAAAEVHHELGPEYSDAVVASFLEKIDREIAARVNASSAGTSQAQAPVPDSRRTLIKGIVMGSVVTGSSLIAAMSGNAGEGKHRFLLILVLWLAVAAGYAISAARAQRQLTSHRTAAGR